MQSVHDILAIVTEFLGVTPNDTILLLSAVVATIIIAVLGLETVYQILFGASLGLGIYILLAMLFSASSWSDAAFVAPAPLAGAIVGSSVYLPFLLAVLIPLNNAVRIPIGRNPLLRAAVSVPLAVAVVAFFGALFTGLSERIGIFDRENLFSLVAKGDWYGWYALTYAHGYAIRWMQLAIVAGVLAVIYRMLLHELVASVAVSLATSIVKRRGSAGGGSHHDDGGHDDHDDG